MTTLTDSLATLREHLITWGLEQSTWEIGIVEIGRDAARDARGRVRVARGEVHRIADYESRFCEVMNSGYPWINMTCYGVTNGRLIVGIELPWTSSKASRTALNYSGPPRGVVADGWRVDSVLVIDELLLRTPGLLLVAASKQFVDGPLGEWDVPSPVALVHRNRPG